MFLKDWKNIKDDKVYKVENTNMYIVVEDGKLFSRYHGFGMFDTHETEGDSRGAEIFRSCLECELIERTVEQEEKYQKVFGWDF